MDTMIRQPGFSRGRRSEESQLQRLGGRGSSRDSCGSGGGSLPPINDRSVSRDSMCPRAGSGRTGSKGVNDSLPPMGKKGSIGRDSSLPPLLQPCSSGDIGDARQNNSVRPPRPQVAQRSQSHTSVRNPDPPQRQVADDCRNGSRAQRPPREPQSKTMESRQQDSPRAERTPPVTRTRSGSQRRTGSSNRRQGENSDAVRSSPRNGNREMSSRPRPSSPPVPAIASQATGRPPSPPIPTLASTSPKMDTDIPDDAADVHLVPCRHCGRKFRPEALAKHEHICVKVFQKERKKFKATEQRAPVEALQLQKEAKRNERREGNKTRPGQAVQAKQNQGGPNWRAKSEAFRRAMADARKVTQYQKEGRDLRDLPPPTSLPPEMDDRVQCPHCGRRFGQQQAERHIPHCKSTKAKPNGILRAHAAAPKPKPRR